MQGSVAKPERSTKKDKPRVKDLLELGDTPLSKLFSLCNTDQTVEYLPERRSLRIHGHSTTIRLERAFWSVLEILAEEEGVPVSGLVTIIVDHCLVANQKNLASCLRVVCLKYINICS